MKRLLVISYYWPPSGGSGVQRWEKFAKYLPGEGWQPVIYTPSNPNAPSRDESLLKEIPGEVEVLKTRILEPGRPSGSKREVNPINASNKGKLALWIRGNCFIPDPKAVWIRPSVKFLEKYLQESPVDAIISTGPPHSMHLIARNLCRSLRKKGRAPKWLADFRDPWTEMFYFKHLQLCGPARKLHYRLEKSVLDEADGIISVTPFVQKDFQAKTLTPVHLITNGFDEDDFACPEAIAYSKTFRIVHTGLFAADGNPLKVWDALSALCSKDKEFADSLQIRLAGKVDAAIVEAIRERGLGDKLHLMGYLSHSETVREQMEASLLILPLRREPEYAKVYPGKIFEYLASRRPVLGTGQSKGAAALLLQETSSGQMFEWEDICGPEHFIARLWKDFREGKRADNSSDISEFTRKSLTQKLVGILEK